MVSQGDLYEILSHLGASPAWAALLAGLAVHDWFGQLVTTPAGDRYIEKYLRQRQRENAA